MPAGLHWLTYGLRIELTADTAALLRRARPRLPPGRPTAGRTRVDRRYAIARRDGAVTIHRDRRLLVRSRDPLAALDALESDAQLYVAEHARDRLFVHAGVVGWRGRAILLPGRSLSGKSTLVAALLRAGARYYSDEYAVLDARGHVRPYPRLLSLRRTQGRPRRSKPEALGARAGKTPLPVGLVVVCRYHAPSIGRRTRAPAPLSAGRCLLALLKNTVAARSRAALAMARLHLVVSSARAVVAERGEAAPFAATLVSWL